MAYSFETRDTAKFTALDYVMFGLMLAVSAVIGIFYAIKDRNKDNTREFLLAGGNMNPIPVALSILASFMSAITLLGTPAEMYNYTTMYWYIGLGYLLVIFVSAHIFIPVFYKMRVTSAYEYLEKRFSKGVRTAGSLTFCTQMILYMAIVLYAPSLALNAVTGFTLWGAIISVGCVCTFYTALGGLKAVLWTDTFQVFVMFAGLFAIVIKGTADVGGLSEAWKYFSDSGRVEFDDFSPDPKRRHSFWSLVIGGMFTWVAVYGTNQAQVQRACSCSSLKEAQIAMWINFPGLCLILYIGCFIGVAVYALYRKCDPIKFDLIDANDQLLPLFVMDVLGSISGVPGLFVASLFSGALSTISSGLNSMAACVLQDVIRAYFIKDMNESTATKVSKVLAVVFGFACLGLTWVASQLGGVLQAALSLFGMIGGPLLGVFTLGMMFPWANTVGAYFGLITGLVFMFWIGIGAYITKPYIPKAVISTVGCNWNLTTTVGPNTTLASVATTVATTVTTTVNQTTVAAVTKSAAQIQEENGGVFYPLYSLSYLWYSATAVLVVVGVGLIVSFITGANKAEDADPRYQVPLFDIIFPFLPEKILKPLRFGVRYDLIGQMESDIKHTAVDIPKEDIDKYFDIEMSATKPGEKNGDISTISGTHVPNGGAYFGLITGLVFMFWIGIGAYITKPYIPKAIISTVGCNWNLTTTVGPNTTLASVATTVATTVTTTVNQTTVAAVTKSAAQIQEENGGVFYPLYSLSYLWYSATAVLVVVGVGLIVSFITGANKAEDADPRYQVPLFDIIFPFLPEKILKPLRFGVRYDLIGQMESDIKHTAVDIPKEDIDKYFDIEMSATKPGEKNGDISTISGTHVPNGVSNKAVVVDDNDANNTRL